MKRETFLKHGLLATTAGLMSPMLFSRPSEEEIFDKDQIYELVLAAHRDVDQTRTILDKSPLLINCTNQFKKGDFETALGGASHMGRKDIADLLISRGARWDIFSLTFLGHTEFVKSMIQSYPQFLHAPGPHGFTLLHHAVVGKHTDFASWLKDQGLTEEHKKGVFGK